MLLKLPAPSTGHGTNTPCRVCEQGATAQLTAEPVGHTGVHSQLDLTLKILFSASSDSSICVAGQDLQTGVFLLWKAAVRMIYLPEEWLGHDPAWVGLGESGQGTTALDRVQNSQAAITGQRQRFPSL